MGTLNNRCRIIIGTQKGAIILTKTHIVGSLQGFKVNSPLIKPRDISVSGVGAHNPAMNRRTGTTEHGSSRNWANVPDEQNRRILTS